MNKKKATQILQRAAQLQQRDASIISLEELCETVDAEGISPDYVKKAAEIQNKIDIRKEENRVRFWIISAIVLILAGLALVGWSIYVEVGLFKLLVGVAVVYFFLSLLFK